MSRIRSIHPGFWTDEALVSLSDGAALFYIGLLNESDDNGVFEWKPVTLRMRLRPTKDGAVDALLAELVRANAIRRYEHEGRQYGAVRNFRKYQRPKKPKAVHPTTPEVETYLGSTRLSGEPEEDEAPPKGELAPQMEEGGGIGKGNGTSDLNEDLKIDSEFGVPSGLVARAIKGALRKADKPDRCWLKLNDTRVPTARQRWFEQYGSELPLHFRGKAQGYLVPWEFLH
jgi:hypothetical protein